MERDGGGAAEAGDEGVATHFADELVVAGHGEGVVGAFDEVVGDGRVVGGVLAEVAGAVGEAALVGLAEQRVEGLVLSCADVEAGELGSNHEFESLEGLCALGCL